VGASIVLTTGGITLPQDCSASTDFSATSTYGRLPVRSRRDRLELLAGLIDTDGHLEEGGKRFSVYRSARVGATDRVSSPDRLVSTHAAREGEVLEVERIHKTDVYYEVGITRGIHAIPTRIHGRRRKTPGSRGNCISVSGFIRSGAGTITGLRLTATIGIFLAIHRHPQHRQGQVPGGRLPVVSDLLSLREGIGYGSELRHVEVGLVA